MSVKIKINKPDFPQTFIRMGSIYVNLGDTLAREVQINNICNYII